MEIEGQLRIKFKIVTLFGALLIFSSCDYTKVFSSYKEVDPIGWNYTEAIDFEFEIDNNKTLFNYLIGLRNNNDYLYSNIFFFVDIKNPDGNYIRDTLQYLLAEPNGKWKGSGVGEIKFNLFQFKFFYYLVYSFNFSI